MPYDKLQMGRISQQGRAYFITTVLASREQNYFRDFDCARLLITEMRALHEEGAVNSLAWVVMPNHLHWLFQLSESHDLSSVVKQLKARSAQRINAHLQRRGALWQKQFYDHAIRDDEDLRQIARYIVANPLRARLVDKIGHYPHWDAVWLSPP
jgi:REP element-mobilizing transposase RayT